MAGPDLMPAIWKATEHTEYSHYFYGSTPETIAALEKNLRSKYPDLKIAGMESPPFRPLTEEEDRQAVERINASGADFVWVGLGAPKQEKWMYEHQGRIHAVMLGVGAGFDFHAGTVKRAPDWMQQTLPGMDVSVWYRIPSGFGSGTYRRWTICSAFHKGCFYMEKYRDENRKTI